ncbi:hypothetical protein DMH12_04610 [Streptomyces sp. WAC 04229]|nr:hypothetical protein DMH12_04610 [Streptomyces sp. WAC 04229]
MGLSTRPGRRTVRAPGGGAPVRPVPPARTGPPGCRRRPCHGSAGTASTSGREPAQPQGGGPGVAAGKYGVAGLAQVRRERADLAGPRGVAAQRVCSVAARSACSLT